MPPTAPVPSVLLPLAPTPDANIIGKSPNTRANDVMRIGRKRAPAPCMAAPTMDMPVRRRSNANSVIRIAFLAKSPINMINDICR